LGREFSSLDVVDAVWHTPSERNGCRPDRTCKLSVVFEEEGSIGRGRRKEKKRRREGEKKGGRSTSVVLPASWCMTLCNRDRLS